MNFQSPRLRPLLAGLCLLFATALCAAEQLPYVGEWSNGRGDTLVITGNTIRFANDKAVPYRDLTRATDGKAFTLQITAPGEVNFFNEKFLALECGDDEMRMVGYNSYTDLQQDRNAGSNVTWYKEDDAAGDD